MESQQDQQPSAATDAGHHPDQRGSAATVLASPQTDSSMTTANPGGAGSTGTGAESKRQKKAVTLKWNEYDAAASGDAPRRARGRPC